MPNGDERRGMISIELARLIMEGKVLDENGKPLDYAKVLAEMEYQKDGYRPEQKGKVK